MIEKILNKCGYIKKEELESANDKIADLSTRINIYIATKKMNDKEIESLKFENKKYAGRIGGYTKHNNKLLEERKTLKKEIEDLNKKLEESMTDKYLVKKLPSGRPRKPENMKVRYSGVESHIVKKMHDND